MKLTIEILAATSKLESAQKIAKWTSARVPFCTETISSSSDGTHVRIRGTVKVSASDWSALFLEVFRLASAVGHDLRVSTDVDRSLEVTVAKPSVAGATWVILEATDERTAEGP